MVEQIIKRDGRCEPFAKSKIVHAIEQAMARAKQNDMDAVNRIAEEIANTDKKTLGVEEVQDMVEIKLMKTSLKPTAKEYITYREHRNIERQRNNRMNKQIEDILLCKNVQNSNANVDEHSFSGRKFESANVLMKNLALNAFCRPEVAKAHQESRIYIHDLSEYPIGDHNCFRSDTKFITDHGTKSFSDFADGDHVTVLTHTGEWKHATVRCFGVQKLNRVTLRRGVKGLRKDVYVTPNHRWILRDGTETTSLSIGDVLIEAPDIFDFDFDKATIDEKEMWCKGFAVGDGTIEYRKNKKTGEYAHKDVVRITLCGAKTSHLDKFVAAGYTVSTYSPRKSDIIVTKKGVDKTLPDVNLLSYRELNAFIHGLYAADGNNKKNRHGYTQMGILFSSPELCDFVEKYFEVAGLYISSKRDKTGQITNYGARKETYEFGFIPHRGYFSYKVTDIVPAGEDLVWCLDVEDTHSFVLSGGIPTGNCLFANLPHLLNNGFSTRNGDVRPAGSFSTACQLVAVIFQIQSQVQFGGVASCHIDYDLAPFVKKSFYKHYADGLKYLKHNTQDEADAFISDCKNSNLSIDDESFRDGNQEDVYQYAMDMLEREGKQAAQSLYHNLNTLESRAGSQIPFTSINFGLDTSPEGRRVTRWLLEASIDGIGKHHLTPIFPISIFQHKKGVNADPGDPNYDLKQLAMQSLSRRIYPNWVNCDFSENHPDPNNPDTEMATMGCRTMLGYDRHGLGYSKVGRGNVCPVTMNLPKIGIKHGICTGARSKPDLDGFWAELDEVLKLTETALVDRFYHICAQSTKSGPFMYDNGTVMDYEKAVHKGVYEAMKHGTLAVGYIGIAEMCQALFGKDHSESKEVWEFAYKVVEHISDFCKEISEKHDLNFSCYAAPAESLCRTYAKALREEFGVIPKVTDREYITNSHHVPVWQNVSIYKKLQIEAPFCKFPTGGCITYIELDASVMNNLKAVESIINYAMSLNIPYLALNFPIDTCLKCGFSGEIEYNCPVCGNTSIQRLRRVTGYLSADYRQFNEGKIAEVLDRVKHNRFTDFGGETGGTGESLRN